MHTLPADIISWSNEDLNWLDQFASAQILALGEAVHTSDGFYSAKVRMIKYLIEFHGYRAIAWETPWGQALSATEYIENGTGSVEDALNGLFRIWRSTSVRDLLIWLRDWNERNPTDKVRFFGNDTQQPKYDFDFLISSSKFPEQSKQGLRLNIIKLFGESIVEGKKYYQSEDYKFRIKNGFEDGAFEALKDMFSGIQLDGNDLEYVAALSLWSYIKFTYYQIECARTNSLEANQISFSARDKCMSDLTLHFSRGEKTLLWAHNEHIQRATYAICKGLDLFQGQFLFKVLGEKYKALGISAKLIDIHWPWANVTAPSVAEDSLEVVLMKKGVNTYAGSSLEFETVAASSYSGMYDLDESGKISDRFDGLLILPNSLGIEYAVKI